MENLSLFLGNKDFVLEGCRSNGKMRNLNFVLKGRMFIYVFIYIFFER